MVPADTPSVKPKTDTKGFSQSLFFEASCSNSGSILLWSSITSSVLDNVKEDTLEESFNEREGPKDITNPD